jgi:hypothetical protein
MIEPIDAPNPDDERANASGLKVHLRVLTVGRYTYRVVTLRSATSARFSSNLFHDTWHILTDREGAFILARLLWGLAFQREPGTVVLLDGIHLVPTPFEADPAVPILVVPDELTRVDVDHLRLLKARLRHPAPQKTIRLHTFGLPQALTENFRQRVRRHDDTRSQRSKEQMQRLGGFVCYTAPQDLLRLQATTIYRMSQCKTVDYHYLAQDEGNGWWRTDGEVQVFPDFRDRVSAATVARHSVLDAHERTTTMGSYSERAAEIHQQAARVCELLKEARRRKNENWSKGR